jgi:hypothetical protein
VVVTAVLVGVTGFYAWQTKKTVESLEKSTRYQFYPFLKAYLGMKGPTHLELIIMNVGKGPAKDVEVEFLVEASPNTRKKWRHQLLMPDDFQKFLVPKNESEVETEIAYFENNQTTLRIKTSYSDLLNNPLSNEQTIDVTSYVKQFKNIFSVFREEPIENIARSIKGIHEETQKNHPRLQKSGKGTRYFSFQKEKFKCRLKIFWIDLIKGPI